MQKLLQDVYFGRNLQIIRKSRNLSQEDMVIKMQLAGRSMSRAQYGHIEQGISNVYMSDLILFKKILNVSYDEFFVGLSPIKD